MTEQEFEGRCEAVLSDVESRIDALDLDSERSDRVLRIELPDDSAVIVNGNGALREIWVAARSGGFHFRFVDGGWIDTRDQTPLMRRLAACLSDQAGHPLDFLRPGE